MKRVSRGVRGVVAALVLAAALHGFAGCGGASAEPPAVPATLADAELAALLQQMSDTARKHPDDAASWAELAKTYHVHGLHAEANAAYARATELAPKDDRLRWLYAVSLAGEGRTDDALARAQESLDAAPQHPGGWTTVAVWHLNRGAAADAVTAARRAVATSADDPGARAVLAQALLESGDAAAAETEARRALGSPEDVPGQRAFAHHVLGRALQTLGRGDEARRHLARGSGAGIRFADPWLADLSEFRASAVALKQHAAELSAAGDVEGAVHVYELLRARERARTPDGSAVDVQVAVDLSRALRRLGRAQDAESVIADALEKKPDATPLWIETAELREAAGDEPGALWHLSGAIERAPQSAAALEARGRFFLRRDRVGEAVLDFEQAFAADPSRAHVLALVGDARLREGDLDAADAAFGRAAEKDPGLADAYAGLALVAARRGDREQATRHLAIAEELGPRGTDLMKAAAAATSGSAPPPPK